VVANVLEVLQLCLLVRRAERARVCRSIVSSRRLDRKERKRRCNSGGGKQLDLEDVDEVKLFGKSSRYSELLSQVSDWLSSSADIKWKFSRHI
jgi:hypothetical protein